MSLRILGGKLKGLALESPPESLTRPTSTMLRRKIFDSHQNLENFCFIDLCAGSGSVGIEALSRGASKIVLVEKNYQALNILQKNKLKVLEKLPSASIQVDKSDVLKWLANNLEKLTKATILFFDPPYEDKAFYEKVIELILNSSFAGELWIESCRQKGLTLEKLEKHIEKEFDKVYWQGTSFLAICSFFKG